MPTRGQWIKEGAFTIECPLCGAKKNRTCTNRGVCLSSGVHKQRKESYIQQEFDSHRKLNEIPITEVKNLHVKSHVTGLIGKIIFVQECKEPQLLIKWDNSLEDKMFYKNASKIIEWEKEYNMTQF